MSIEIIGLGLIERSMALTLRQANFWKKNIGTDQNPQNTSRTLEFELVEKIVSLDVLILQSELIILAIPVDRIKKMSAEFLEQIPNKSIVFDTGSTKDEIYQAVADHPNRDRFLSSHLIADTKYSGLEATFSKLFKGKITILRQAEYSTLDILKTAEKVYTQLRMFLVQMNSKAHDLHLSYISHFSHVLFFKLARTVLNIERDKQNIFHLAVSGFSSTVHLDKKSQDTWIPISRSNKTNLLKVIETYINQLSTFRTSLQKKQTRNDLPIYEGS
ncbi:MAG: prephenate dehydrogenase/arogenate dehydrogenase family protein [Flavobacteriales bacterium AspAUS03]